MTLPMTTAATPTPKLPKFNRLMSWGCNLLLVSLFGYFMSLGIDIDGEDIATAIQHPMSVDWSETGVSVVQIGLEMREDIDPILRGPVADFIDGIKGEMLSQADAFDYEQPDYDVAFAGFD